MIYRARVALPRTKQCPVVPNVNQHPAISRGHLTDGSVSLPESKEGVRSTVGESDDRYSCRSCRTNRSSPRDRQRHGPVQNLAGHEPRQAHISDTNVSSRTRSGSLRWATWRWCASHLSGRPPWTIMAQDRRSMRASHAEGCRKFVQHLHNKYTYHLVQGCIEHVFRECKGVATKFVPRRRIAP